MRSLVRRIEQEHPDREYYVEDGQIKYREVEPMTEEERENALELLKPITFEVVLFYLKKLAARKHISDDSKERKRVIYILREDAERLVELGVNEIKLHFAVEHLIMNDPDPFYPQFHRIRKLCGL